MPRKFQKIKKIFYTNNILGTGLTILLSPNLSFIHGDKLDKIEISSNAIIEPNNTIE